MDWHSRYVLAWRLSNTLKGDFCVAALEEALSKGRPQIFNTDQGSQFTSEAFTSMLLAQGVQVSMDGRGRCMDNVFVERLWRSIKYEDVYLKAYQNGTEARKGIGAYLAFYNQERPHQALGYRSPGQVFQAMRPQRCLLEHPPALPSDEALPDTPAVDSLILASPLSEFWGPLECGRGRCLVASIGCSCFGDGLSFQQPLSQKHRSTFLPPQPASALISSVDRGLSSATPKVRCYLTSCRAGQKNSVDRPRHWNNGCLLSIMVSIPASSTSLGIP